MPSGHLMTMPMLIINMGGEMVYILEQRLHAQKIPEHKGLKVMTDVVRTMYYPRFVEELFKPQEIYSMQSTRQIFDRLAHSSIMRLNESSMDKLFDLMAMGFKFQIMSCCSPKEMVDVTQNHLEALRRLVGATPHLVELIDETLRQMHKAYGNMSLADCNSLRQSLCGFFQDRKVKVSLFLNDHTQKADGSIVVQGSGVQQPGQLPLGTVRYFQGGAQVQSETLPVVSAGSWVPHNGNKTILGSNLYDKENSSGRTAQGAGSAAAAPVAQTQAPGTVEANTSTAAAVGELNNLASLIRVQQPTAEEGNFKLENLFGQSIFPKDSGRQEVIEIDGAGPSAHRQGLAVVRQQLEALSVTADGTQQEDLLDLMDKA
mmetsp:Transcript_30397/g.66598  ORF Transcript_30397/g.66598 Transcript_30397/m.66598 type:complete len:373 (-) Transcript_30397:192-1310(-)